MPLLNHKEKYQMQLLQVFFISLECASSSGIIVKVFFYVGFVALTSVRSGV